MDNLPSAPAPISLTTSPKDWRKPSWLSGWTLEFPVPVPMTEVHRELREVESLLTPCDPKRTAVMLAQTLELYGLPDNWAKVAPFYLEAMADVPPDLVADALKHVRLTCKWFPKPSELRAGIETELLDRSNVKYRLRTALRGRPMEESPRRPPTDEEKARVAGLVAHAAASLRAGRQ